MIIIIEVTATLQHRLTRERVNCDLHLREAFKSGVEMQLSGRCTRPFYTVDSVDNLVDLVV